MNFRTFTTKDKFPVFFDFCRYFVILFLILMTPSTSQAQHSVARDWNEALLQSIREDFARPTVHARNLWHVSVAMYDAWAAYDDTATPFLLGNTVDGFMVPFNGVPTPTDIEAARNEAISFAAYRLLRHRFQNSPGAFAAMQRFDNLMTSLGYNINNQSPNYASGSPAMLGNFIALNMINFGLQDGSNESTGYNNQYYNPVNAPLITQLPGNTSMSDPNRWQPLTLNVFIDQSGNVIPFNTPGFLSPEWGNVTPFCMTAADMTTYQRGGNDFRVYHDPGPPPQLDITGTGGLSEEYKWGFGLVSKWSSLLDPSDGEMIDISPASIGNVPESAWPTTIPDLRNFYDEYNGGDPSLGHTVNPVTGQPYATQMVLRGDYTRVLAEFWADGPDSETPPGHWFSILNYINDHPQFSKKYRGFHEMETDLEFDVKAYFMMGAAMHDCAISAWGIKGHYDYIRPVSAIRAMCDSGQSTDPSLPSYSNLGMPLIPGYSELVEAGDPLAGNNNEHVGKVKLYTWKGPEYIDDPEVDIAGVDWILGENWWPYQRPSFVTPNFAGYISGHSTYSRAAAELLTTLTGDEFFPGGIGEFEAPMNEFLVFEEGPSETITLQWATYRDASDETSLSRIWGGIHPPADDIPGRKIGIKIAADVFELAETYFFQDVDNDGFYNYEDCDDSNPLMNPGLSEECDAYDNDCNGLVNDGVPLNTYYFDTDGDGFGELTIPVDTCIMVPPPGYVTNAEDCDDLEALVYPGQVELCDAIDNDCDGQLNNGLQRYTYYLDFDNDGYGDFNSPLDTCIATAPMGFVEDLSDCNDDASNIYPSAIDIPDNGIDEDCSGFDFFEKTQFLPNGIVFDGSGQNIKVQYNYTGTLNGQFFAANGKMLKAEQVVVENNFFYFELPENLVSGIYILRMYDKDADIEEVTKVLVVK